MKRAIIIVTAAAVCAGILPLYACTPAYRENNTTYTISVQFDGGNKLTGSVSCDVYNDTDNALDCLKFNLWGNAFREGAAYAPVSSAMQAQTYYDGPSYGAMEITAVEGGQWQVCGEDQNILEITLGATLYPDERAQVVINYELTLANANARTGVCEGAVNLGNFYPVLCEYGQSGWMEYVYCATGDPFVSAVADYDVTITMPASFTAAASGKLSDSSGNGDSVTCRYELENARDFAFVLSENFEKISREQNGTTIYYYYLSDGDAQRKLDIAAQSLSYFETTFGEYPYPTLSVVQTGFAQGGMEYPGLTMISSDCDQQTALYTIVHENAHQWWYAAVGSDQFAHSWQDEGLAEYSTLMFFEDTPAYGFTRAGITGSATRAYRAYFSVYSQLFEGVDTGMDRDLTDFSGDYEYANIAYNKALLMLDAVRGACGDDNFTDALRNYYREYKFAVAPPEGLIACFCRRADCEGIFDSFLNGKVII